LKEVHPDKIILLRNGRFETLRMPEEVIAGVNESLPSRRASATQQNSVSSVVTPEAARVLNEYKQKLESDPQSVMSAVRAEPYRVGGDIKGYRVFPGRDKELLGQVGLKPGDVVTSVNGIELDNPLKGLEIMKQLKEASQVSVDVLRNGVNQTFVVPVN
ncbi:MAG: hypothetical protein OEX00_12550, partial [Gammaproteobacteria bacterium]|nr:hypothetical protein [Gammaproteobacteria bacterium]